jgi:hypothetical protein
MPAGKPTTEEERQAQHKAIWGEAFPPPPGTAGLRELLEDLLPDLPPYPPLPRGLNKLLGIRK